MTGSGEELPKISPASTKKEMLDAYNQLVEKLKEQDKAELKPEKVKEERKAREVVHIADTISADPVLARLNDLKTAIAKELSDLAGKLEQETGRYNQIKSAIALKDQELREIFEIERSAFSLAALMESQKQKKLEFEMNMEERKKQLEDEIQQTRALWEKEKQQYMETRKEQKTEDEKIRKREKEEYEYGLKREQELNKARLKDEIEGLEKDLQKKKADFDLAVAARETDLAQREKVVSEREKLIDELQAKVAAFPSELEARVQQAVKQAVDSVKSAAQKNEELLLKGFEGEKNVLLTRIEGLEKAVTAQSRQIEGLSRQLEKAYEKVQDIAVKAVSRPQMVNPSNQRTSEAEKP